MTHPRTLDYVGEVVETRAGTHRWEVRLGGELDATFRSRAAAREYAAWLRRHPSVRDRADVIGAEWSAEVEVRRRTIIRTG